MSENTSPRSPTSSRGWTEDAIAGVAGSGSDYDGAEEIERTWRAGLTPDLPLTVSEWADRYRILSPKSAAEPGRWRTSRTPYLKEIMDCLSVSSPVQRVAFMKGAQIGATESELGLLRILRTTRENFPGCSQGLADAGQQHSRQPNSFHCAIISMEALC